MEEDNSIELHIEEGELLDEEKKKLFSEIEKGHKINKNSVCDNYISAFIIFFIESLISLICFYLFYILDFVRLYEELRASFIFLLIILLIIVPYFISSSFYENHEKLRNYILFILISLHKIIFGLMIYNSTIFYSDKILGFSHFEARAYWKVSMCLFYLMLIFYSYFKREKNSDRLYMYIIFSAISLTIFILLVFYTQKRSDKGEVLGLYIILTGGEVIFLLIGIYLEKLSTVEIDDINIDVD